MKKLKICIDAGHGEGYNPSPCGFGYAEGTRMFYLAGMLKMALERYGVEVVTTRNCVSDYPSLIQRAQYGKGCDLLLSLHSNAVGEGTNEEVDYVRVYYPISGKGKGLAAALAERIAETMGTVQKPQYLTRINGAGTADYYGVIRHSAEIGVPALILEHSFHTNSRSTQWLMHDVNLWNLAQAEAKTIADYYGLGLIIDEPRKDAEPELVEDNTEKGGTNEVRYATVGELKKDPNAGHYLPTVEKLIEKGFLRGKGGEGDELILDLSEDSVRIMVTLDRAGMYGE